MHTSCFANPSSLIYNTSYQTISGISVSIANSTSGRAALIATIAGVASISSSSVNINSVSSVITGNSFKSSMSLTANYELSSDTLHTETTRKLAGSGVIVKYTLSVVDGQYTTLVSTIRTSVSSGSFTSSLKSNGGTSFSDATASVQPTVVDRSPSSAPTSTPVQFSAPSSSSGPTMAASSSSSSSGPTLSGSPPPTMQQSAPPPPSTRVRKNVRGLQDVHIASSATVSQEASPTFCMVKMNNLLGFPFFLHYGPAGSLSFNTFEPQRCLCGDSSGTSPRSGLIFHLVKYFISILYCYANMVNFDAFQVQCLRYDIRLRPLRHR